MGTKQPLWEPIQRQRDEEKLVPLLFCDLAYHLGICIHRGGDNPRLRARLFFPSTRCKSGYSQFSQPDPCKLGSILNDARFLSDRSLFGPIIGIGPINLHQLAPWAVVCTDELWSGYAVAEGENEKNEPIGTQISVYFSLRQTFYEARLHRYYVFT